MMWLSNSALARLRDRLRERGAPASHALPFPASLLPEELERAVSFAEYGPLCEAMYLMMSADQAISADERNVLRGALRELSDGSVRSSHIDAMLEQAEKDVAREGRVRRLEVVAASLRDDVCRAEVAFVLAAAIAFADGAVADEENEMLSDLAERMGIDESKASSLLDGVEADLGLE
jgi:tellurite resistance protein